MRSSNKAVGEAQEGPQSASNRWQAEALLRAVPRRVHGAALFASLVGIFFLLRFGAAAYLGKIALGKAILYGLPLLGLLFMNGFSLVNRSRSGYIIVAVTALLPILGLLAYSLHLVKVSMLGSWATDEIGLLPCLLGAAQLCVTGVLFFYLLSPEVRSHVWKQKSEISGVTPLVGGE